jgi:hypothetical protein
LQTGVNFTLTLIPLKLISGAAYAYKGTYTVPTQRETYQVNQLTLQVGGNAASGGGIFGAGNFGADSLAPFLLNMTRIK